MTIFLKFHDLWVVFKGLEFLKQTFVSKKLKYRVLILWNICLFWILSFAKDILLQKFDCVFVLAIRGLLRMIKNFVLWCDFFCVLITFMESFEKKSFLKEVMVLSKTCVHFRNYLFIRKDLSPLWKKFENVSILRVDFSFFCLRKLNFWIWEGDFWVKPLERS